METKKITSDEHDKVGGIECSYGSGIGSKLKPCFEMATFWVGVSDPYCTKHTEKVLASLTDLLNW